METCFLDGMDGIYIHQVSNFAFKDLNQETMDLPTKHIQNTGGFLQSFS